MQLQEFLQDLNAKMSASKTTGFWSEEDKKRWINKAIVRACNFARWKFLRKPSTINTEKDKEAYYLPFDYKSMISLKVDGEIYHPTDPEDYQSGNYAWEKVYTIMGDQFLINPTIGEDGKTIDIYHIRRPVRLVDLTDEPITPEEMDEPIVKFALAICLKKEPGRKNDAKEEILEANSMLQETKNREDEEPSSVYKGRAISSRQL